MKKVTSSTFYQQKHIPINGILHKEHTLVESIQDSIEYLQKLSEDLKNLQQSVQSCLSDFLSQSQQVLADLRSVGTELRQRCRICSSQGINMPKNQYLKNLKQFAMSIQSAHQNLLSEVYKLKYKVEEVEAEVQKEKQLGINEWYSGVNGMASKVETLSNVLQDFRLRGRDKSEEWMEQLWELEQNVAESIEKERKAQQRANNTLATLLEVAMNKVEECI